MSSSSVFITGAAAGIGAAATRLLASSGYTVYAGIRPGSGQPDADADAGAGVHLVPADVTDPASVAEAAAYVTEQTRGRGLHAVINNAGVIVQGPLELISPDDWNLQFAVNTAGPAIVTRAFLPLLRAGSGRVINIGAPTARIPVPFLAALSASKAALAALSDALRLELAAWDIPVAVVEPGGTSTQIFAKAAAAAEARIAAADPETAALYASQLRALAAATASQRLGPADAVARTIVAAVQARKPKRHYVVGTDARAAGMLSHLPAGLRERVLLRTLGLSKLGPMSSAA